MTAEERIAEVLVEEMKKRAWSQEVLAKKVGMNQSSISKIVRPPTAGRRRINVNEMIAISDALGIPITHLLGMPTDPEHWRLKQLERQLTRIRSALETA